MVGSGRRRRSAAACALAFAAAFVMLAGCGAQRSEEDRARSVGDNPTRRSAEPMPESEDDGVGTRSSPIRAVVPFENIGGQRYADAEKLAGLIGFHTEYTEDGSTLLVGDHDPELKISAGSREAVKADRTVTMALPAVLADGRMLVPSNELKKLFGDEALIAVDSKQAVVMPQPPDGRPESVGDFADDSAGTASGRNAGGTWRMLADGDDGSTSSANAELIKEAKRYLGVQYQFGAAHYSVSKRFDCSSFVQYLFAGQGIELPRTARAQALLGKEVPRDKLRPGDLLFFHVPGRFKDHETIGHVGIYMGGGKMIHSSPLPLDGVQITDIDRPYWKETFRVAKRILQT